jgi:hypothetical protein
MHYRNKMKLSHIEACFWASDDKNNSFCLLLLALTCICESDILKSWHLLLFGFFSLRVLAIFWGFSKGKNAVSDPGSQLNY